MEVFVAARKQNKRQSNKKNQEIRIEDRKNERDNGEILKGSDTGIFCEINDKKNKMFEEKDGENSLKIDLLKKGQKLKQFKEMVNNQYLLNDSQVEGASPNFYTKKVFTKGISNILQGFYSAYEIICLYA